MRQIDGGRVDPGSNPATCIFERQRCSMYATIYAEAYSTVRADPASGIFTAGGRLLCVILYCMYKERVGTYNRVYDNNTVCINIKYVYCKLRVYRL